jgi:hypothetical protein
MTMIRERSLCAPTHLRISLAVLSVVGTLLVPMCVAAQEQSLLIAASFADKVVNPDESIELLLSRPEEKSEGRLAVIIGTTDVTTVFTHEKLKLRYNPKLWPLPVGESLVVVYLVSTDNEWKEVARFALRVAKEKASGSNFLRARFSDLATPTRSIDRGPFAPSLDDPTAADEVGSGQQPSAPSAQPSAKKNKMKFTPSLTLTINSQPAQSTFPGPQPERARFTELNLQATLKNDMEVGIFKSESSFDFAGASFQQATLRFGTLGNDAPKVDLSSYLFQIQTGKVKYQVGHFSYGTQRQLINSFSSRGLQITVPFLKRFDFSVAAMNGTQLVGYDNFFGLSKSKHQMLSGTLGVEFVPKRPGGLRVEVGLLSAYFQPISGANRGVVTDLQRSRGVSVRVIANDKSDRFHFEGGFTRSFFVSPSDTTLNQGTNVVTLPALTRNAHYLEASYNILKNHSLTKTKKANLTIAFREENVAPLFRSLGASTQADKIQYEVSVNGNVDEISAQFSHVNFHDNLKNIPSILKSLTGSTHISAAAPARAVFFWLSPEAKKSAWLPRLGYSFDRTHQFGSAVPVNGGFEIDPSSVPNFFGTNQTFSADWQIKKYTIGYNLNHSLQDNQQKGRETADQGVFVNTGRFGIPLGTKLNLNVDLSAESSANNETGRVDRNYRAGPGLSWTVTKHLGLSANLANTIAGDRAHTNHSRNTEFDATVTYRFAKGEGLKKVSGQCFLRYANHYSFARDNVFATTNLRKNQTLTLNVGFTFF